MKTCFTLLLTLLSLTSFSQSKPTDPNAGVKIELTKKVLVCNDVCKLFLESPSFETKGTIYWYSQEISTLENQLSNLDSETREYIKSCVLAYVKISKLSPDSKGEEIAMCRLGLEFINKMAPIYIPKIFCH